MPYGTINGQINLKNIIGTATQTTTSTTFVSTGVGVTLGASYTGRFLILFSASVSNSTATDGVSASIFLDSTGGAVPAANAATTGSQVANTTATMTSATNNAIGALAIATIDNRGISQSLTYYIAYSAVTAGTASWLPSSTNGFLTIIEI